MQKVQLGRSGMRVSTLALGGNVFGWTIDERRSFEVLDAFVAAGGNFIDTADIYSRWHPGNAGGESETIIGRWMKSRGNRNDIVIATKVGMEMGPGARGLSPTYVARAVEDSLRRLQTDRIDLYQSHEDDPDTPFEATLGTYAKLIHDGKVRAIGASNFTAPRLAAAMGASAALGTVAYCSLQPHYSLMERQGFESALAGVCREYQLAVLPYFPLASGFLTGKYRSEADLARSARGPAVARYLGPRGQGILAALDAIAAERQVPVAAIALAWLRAKPDVVAPIASATSPTQLEALVASASLTLDDAAVRVLDNASVR
ncbi:MAG: aldo/keto reductase [Betaproteobacteria bacterium]